MANTEDFCQASGIALKEFIKDYEELRKTPQEESPYSAYTTQDYEELRKTPREESPYSAYTTQDYEELRKTPQEESPYSAYTTQNENDTNSDCTDIRTYKKDGTDTRLKSLVPAQSSCNRKRIGLIAFISIGLTVVSSIAVIVVYVHMDQAGTNVPPGTTRSTAETASLSSLSSTKTTTTEKTTVPPGTTRSTAETASLSSLSSTKTTTTEKTTETSEWSAWGDWTQCTATCNTGMHKRYRSCNSNGSLACLGDYVEAKSCFETTCPVYGKWTTWAQWGSCDVTCGGGVQIRTRSCTKVDSAYLECVGTISQEKACSVWGCPDCSQICPVGSLNQECNTCVCEDSVVSGRVISESTGYPVSNAVFYPKSAPTSVLTHTNATGFFTLKNTCNFSEILVIRQGFVDTVVQVNRAYIEISLTPIVLPYLSETPQSKFRLSGDNVTFCCEAMAVPAIRYFEWFKDSVVLDSSLYTNGSQLSFHQLTTADSGAYQCRANSDAGAILSPVATLLVKEEPEDFCSDALQQKAILLPDDCIQSSTNTATYEVGECLARTCAASITTDEGTCRENGEHCCSTSKSVLKTVQCSDYELSVVVVVSCGCSVCGSSSLKIVGNALALGDGTPIRFGKVYVNGNFETYTSNTGYFSFSFSKSTSRLTVSIHDIYFMTFLPGTKVLEISEELSGTIEIEIRMIRVSDPVIIDPLVDSTISAGSLINSDVPKIEISIPAHSFYDLDGNQHAGTVEASLTFLDPANLSDFENIPGVFQFIDEEGQVGNLASWGVFNIFFQDTSGNPLMVADTVEMSIPAELDTNVTTQNFQLWRLNSATGNWDLTGASNDGRRRKRQNTATWVGEIDGFDLNQQLWLNYDAVENVTDSVCYFKYRLYKDENMTEIINNPKRYINLQYHILRNMGELITIVHYTKDPENACVPAICKDNRAFISALYYGRDGFETLYAGTPISEVLGSKISADKRVLTITMSSSINGPFYTDDDVCFQSTNNLNYLRFNYGETEFGYIVMEKWKIPPDFDPRNPATTSKERKLEWYPKREEVYRVCYLKVIVKFRENPQVSPGETIKLRVTSHIGIYEDLINTILGIHDYKVPLTKESSIFCIEYKCSGTIDPKYDPQNDFTKVKIELLHPKSDIICEIIEEADLLLKYPRAGLNTQQRGNTDGIFIFYAPTEYGQEYGVFSSISDADKLGDADNRAEMECNKSKDNSTTGTVTFFCSNKDGDYQKHYWDWG